MYRNNTRLVDASGSDEPTFLVRTYLVDRKDSQKVIINIEEQPQSDRKQYFRRKHAIIIEKPISLNLPHVVNFYEVLTNLLTIQLPPCCRCFAHSP